MQSTRTSCLPEVAPLGPTDYIVGLQCLRRLAHRAGRRGETTGSAVADVDGFTVTETDISEVESIRALAFDLYPEGSAGRPLDRTGAAELHAGTYLNVTLVGEEVEGVVDVLRSGRRGWELATVETGTSVKGSYVSRIAFLAYIARSIGLDVDRATVLTLDKRYYRELPEEESLRARDVFRAHDVSGSVMREPVEKTLAGILDAWRRPESILRTGEYRCRRPDTCEACSVLVSGELGLEGPRRSDTSIFTLHRGGETSRSLYHEGIRSLLEIPESVPLSRAQSIQIEAVRTGKTYIDVDSLSRFLDRLHYPLCFLDFEALMYAVPRYTLTRPWQHVAFQYSLHRVERPAGPVEHRSFIAEPGTDPRPPLVDSLHRHLGDAGSIVVYGRTFESGVLKRLGRYFARHEEWARAAIARVVDLSEPFQSFSVYHPSQRGRVSMKRVLPALTGVGYGEHEIGDGRSASLVYQALCRRAEVGRPVDPQTYRQIARHLREYCALDTYGMYLIYLKLRQMARTGAQ